jgi:predicted esterase
MDDGPTSFFQSRRPAEVDTDALPTPTVNDCPTPLLAAMTGLHKLSLSRMPTTPEKSSCQELLSPRRTREKTRIGPRSLPPPFILQPRDGCHHAGTVIMLHGFTSSGKQLASGWIPALARRLGQPALSSLKLVFLNAPVRAVSCYEGSPRHPAWHDYYTDHGGADGTPEVEEEIDEGQLAWSRAKIHEVIDGEAELLGGDYARVAIGGASQGCCTALDAALTHPKLLAGVFASFGHVYKSTLRAVGPDKTALKIFAFHGACDHCIAASLALRSYAELFDKGLEELRVHVEPKLTHCQPSEAESFVFAEALRAWGLVATPAMAPGPPSTTTPSPRRKVRQRRVPQIAPAMSGTTATSGNAKAEDSSRMRSGQRGRPKAGAAIEAAWQAEVELV